MHSIEVTKEVVEKSKVLGSIEIYFDNYNLSEEIRVNQLFKGWNIGKPEYKKNQFSKIYKVK